jgi:hypothetical protein
MIQMNHDMIAHVPGSRYPTVAEWDTLRTLRDDAIRIFVQLNTLKGAIASSPDYILLSSTEVAALTALINKHGNIHMACVNYDRAGRAAYTSGALPPTIPVIP